MWEATLIIGVLLITLWLLWRKRKYSVLKKFGIPGPEPNILLGNLWELSTEGPLKCHKKWTQQYGRVSGYYFGTKPIILVTDLDLLKKIQISEFHKFPNRPDFVYYSFRFLDDKKLVGSFCNLQRLFQTGQNRSSTVEQEGMENNLITIRDKRWKDIRSIVTPSFTTSKMKLMSSIISKAVGVLIENIEKNAETKHTFDIYKLYQGLTMDVICRSAFGVQTDAQKNSNDPFLRTAKIILAGSLSSFLSFLSISFPELASFWYFLRGIRNSLQNRGRNPRKELTDTVTDVIKLRRREKSSRRNDLLQLMIEAEMSESDLRNLRDEDLVAGDDEKETEKESNGTATKQPSKSLYRMTDAEIVDNAILFVLAGYETTSTTLAFITHFLIHYPDVQERLRKELKDLTLHEGSLDYASLHKLPYMDQVIKETLRIYPPIHLFVNREVGEDVKFGSMTLGKGTAVQVPIYILHHDPEFWEDPEKFDPERFSPGKKSSHNPMAWQPFGAGPRNCVGMRFAQMEIKFALAKILQKYRLVSTDESDKDPLPLRVTPSNMTPANGINVKAVRL